MSCDGNPTPEARAASLDAARQAGHVVIFGEPKTLQLDLDSKTAEAHATFMLAKFAEHLGVIVVHRSTSPGGNAHFYVRLAAEVCRADRLFWQAALGSDPTREALNWLWMSDGHMAECFLIETEFYDLVEVKL